jgi:hypothetical protein
VIEQGGLLGLWVGDELGRTVRIKTQSDEPMIPWTWYSVAASYHPVAGRAILHQEPIVNATNGLLGRAYPNRSSSLCEMNVANLWARSDAPFIIAGYAATTDSGAPIVAATTMAKSIGRESMLARWKAMS